MAITKAVGTGVDIASTYGSAVTMSAITNATEAVATLAVGHGVVVGDYLEVTSGWGKLTGRIVRAKTVASNDVTLESVNTTSVSDYPAGAGAGSIRRITAWTEITQRTPNFSTSGGEVTYADVTTLQDTEERKLPIRRGAVDMSIPGFFDLSLGWVATVRSASDTSTPTGVRVRFPNGNKLVGNAYWSFRDAPTIEDFTLRDGIDLTFAAKAISYAS
jgi:hypothetical protein